MTFSKVAYILRQHGCLRSCKNILLYTYRQCSSRPKNFQKQKAKVLAAAAASSLKGNVQHKITNQQHPNVIGMQEIKESTTEHANSQEKNDNIGSALHGMPDNILLVKRKYENPVTPIVSEKNSLEHCEARDVNLQNVINDVHSLKVKDNEVHGISTFIYEKEECKKCNEQITLLNAVKPTDLQWNQQTFKFPLLFRNYLKLSKIRLTGLVVLTTAAGYGMAPAVLQPDILLYTLVGTGFMSAAANTVNQFLEVPYDSQMARTKNRVLIRGLLTPVHAVTFASCCTVLGISLLYFGVNGITATLGVTNLLLYTSVYTPLKRCSILNTWVGSVVGAIPPLMGWAAATGSLNMSGLLLGAILYSWQFPHFNALSWNLRPDYSKAGYRMMSVVNPALCQRTALRHSVAILVYCSISPLVGLTTWSFAIDSLPLNSYLIYCSWKFYRNADSQSSRKLFRLSLIHLPTLMLLMFVGKKYSHNTNKGEENQDIEFRDFRYENIVIFLNDLKIKFSN